jgi:hypothetical protein
MSVFDIAPTKGRVLNEIFEPDQQHVVVDLNR